MIIDVLPKPDSLFVDGGVVLKNPSYIGGTFAWCLTNGNGIQTNGYAEYVHPFDLDKSFVKVTNNQTEMLALIEGLEHLPWEWKGTIYSDSRVTLGRVFDMFAWKNIPVSLHMRYQSEVKRLVYFKEFKHVLLKGHPTKKDLKVGFNKDGIPVSLHNVWCDEQCKRQALKMLEYQNGGS